MSKKKKRFNESMQRCFLKSEMCIRKSTYTDRRRLLSVRRGAASGDARGSATTTAIPHPHLSNLPACMSLFNCTLTTERLRGKTPFGITHLFAVCHFVSQFCSMQSEVVKDFSFFFFFLHLRCQFRLKSNNFK